MLRTGHGLQQLHPIFVCFLYISRSLPSLVRETLRFAGGRKSSRAAIRAVWGPRDYGALLMVVAGRLANRRTSQSRDIKSVFGYLHFPLR